MPEISEEMLAEAALAEQARVSAAYGDGIRHAIGVVIVALRKAALNEESVAGSFALMQAADGLADNLERADREFEAEVAEEVVEGELV